MPLKAAFTCVGTTLERSKKAKVHAPLIATREDLDRAIASLSPADERRVEKFARYKVHGLGRWARGQTYEDLMQQAMVSIYEGADSPESGRHWRKEEVPFVMFVTGAIRSIASHWLEAHEKDEEYTESGLLVESDEGDFISPLDAVPSGEPNQERQAVAREKLGFVLKLFTGDDDAVLIIEGWEIGMTGPEIIKELGMPPERYEAGVKRIRYRVKAR
jgi:DNA-directed RNA polymerase specialized sigma24 family protein